MNILLKILKWIGLTILALLLIITMIGTIFLNTSPQFGGSASEEQVAEYKATGHFADGVWINPEPIDMKLDCHSVEQMVKEMFTPDPNVSPKNNIEVVKLDPESIGKNLSSKTRITWFGHSSFLIEIDGLNILIDPVFGQYAAPHPLLGRSRYNRDMPIEIEELPKIDAIFISHDHYDHLDYPSIEKLKNRTDAFFVPLGVGNHLRAWGIADDIIQELDWWEETALATLKIVFTPSRHMSGRGLTDQSATLWGSWVLHGKTGRIFFSGDGGYGAHFAEIGKKYGPFHIGLMECGQYNKLWADVHMMPEQTVQAAKDVGAIMIVPIHWGSFTLATHSWIDPIERVTAEARAQKLRISTPQIGETLILGSAQYPSTRWWERH
ncbi:MAG: hypothetical protein COB85_03225 [Bacteroidetes bacterium]|nr:MAG: hypothetical protein COB85_03225 [Bacteroidota bacterium]